MADQSSSDAKTLLQYEANMKSVVVAYLLTYLLTVDLLGFIWSAQVLCWRDKIRRYYAEPVCSVLHSAFRICRGIRISHSGDLVVC